MREETANSDIFPKLPSQAQLNMQDKLDVVRSLKTAARRRSDVQERSSQMRPKTRAKDKRPSRIWPLMMSALSHLRPSMPDAAPDQPRRRDKLELFKYTFAEVSVAAAPSRPLRYPYKG